MKDTYIDTASTVIKNEVLRDSKSQVSLDSLLNVHEIHEITCPLINALKFEGAYASKNYKVELDFNPHHLKVDVTNLLKATNDLNTWSHDILDIFNNLPNSIKNNIAKYINKDDYTVMIENLNRDHTSELKEYSDEINSIIEEWQKYRTEVEDADEIINENQKKMSICEKELLFLKVNDSDTTDCNTWIEFYKEEINEQEENKKDILKKFDRYIKDDFSKQTKNFSIFLEDVRMRNDNLRCEISDIKYKISQKCKDLLALYQPNEYLDMRFGSSPTVLNLGVMFNSTKTGRRDENYNFFSLINELMNKGYINSDQNNKLSDIRGENESMRREERKETLLAMLKENGFIKVRYYNDQDEYKKDRNVFQEQTLNKPLYKEKIKDMIRKFT